MSKLSRIKYYNMSHDAKKMNAPFKHTREQMINLANEHIQAVQAWLSTRTPEAKRFIGKGVIANCSGLPVALLNLALGSHYPPGTSDEVIENEIESVKTFYHYQSVPWSWWIAPNPNPADMIQRLERHNLICNFQRPVMVAPLPAHYKPLRNPDIQVWPASTSAHLEAASTIRQISFGFPEGAADNYFETMAENWLSRERGTLYMASLKNEPPAAIGALITGAGLPGVYIMGTLDERRRHGLGSAILSRILADAAALGYQFIVLTASPLGYPLYRKFGFLHIFDYLGFGKTSNGAQQPLERRGNRRSNYNGLERRSTVAVNS